LSSLQTQSARLALLLDLIAGSVRPIKTELFAQLRKHHLLARVCNALVALSLAAGRNPLHKGLSSEVRLYLQHEYQVAQHGLDGVDAFFVGGLLGVLSIVLVVLGCSDIGVLAAMVASGAAWAGLVVMAYASTWLRSAASACRAAGFALLVACVRLVQGQPSASLSAVNRGSHSSTSTICCNSRVMASTRACSEACSVCEGV
jgi:hypothetical protein